MKRLPKAIKIFVVSMIALLPLLNIRTLAQTFKDAASTEPTVLVNSPGNMTANSTYEISGGYLTWKIDVTKEASQNRRQLSAKIQENTQQGTSVEILGSTGTFSDQPSLNEQGARVISDYDKSGSTSFYVRTPLSDANLGEMQLGIQFIITEESIVENVAAAETYDATGTEVNNESVVDATAVQQTPTYTDIVITDNIYLTANVEVDETASPTEGTTETTDEQGGTLTGTNTGTGGVFAISGLLGGSFLRNGTNYSAMDFDYPEDETGKKLEDAVIDGNTANYRFDETDYIKQGDVYVHKSVREVKDNDEQGLFEVTLKVKGETTVSGNNGRIVFVLDKSSSMTANNRYNQSLEAMLNFASQFMNEATSVEIAIVTFGLDGNVETYSDGTNFTSNLDVFSAKIAELETARTFNNDNSFISEGINVGSKLIASLEGDVTPIMITLSDGGATVSYEGTHSVGYTSYTKNTDFMITQFSANRIGIGSDRFNMTGQVSYHTANGNHHVKTHESPTASFAEMVRNGINPFTGTNDGTYVPYEHYAINVNPYQTVPGGETDVIDSMFNRVATDSDHYQKTETGTVSDYLQNLFARIFTDSIDGGTITDILGEQTIFQPGTLSATLNEGTATNIAESNGIITATDLNLGKDDEYIITYQIRIKTETDDFKPEYFYLANEDATLTMGGETVANFPNPSIKAPGTSIVVTKAWVEYNGDTSGRTDVTFTVGRSPETGTSSWSATGTLTATDATAAGSDTWRNTFSQLTKSLPLFNNEGVNFIYTVTDEADVPGYSKNIEGNTITNTLIFKQLTLNVLKVSDQGDTPLAGAQFTLWDSDGNAIFTDLETNDSGNLDWGAEGIKKLGPGEYTLEETSAPNGHILPTDEADRTWTIIVASDGTVTIDGVDVTLTDSNLTIPMKIVNTFDLVPVQVEKQSNTDEPVKLTGAVFKLEKGVIGEDGQFAVDGNFEPLIATSELTPLGLAEFFTASDDGLTPGTYRITETSGPNGYDTIAGEYILTVDKYGAITTTEETEIADYAIFTLIHRNGLKDFDIIVNKVDDLGKALTGATFELTKKDDNSFNITLPTDTNSLSTFNFEDLEPGEYYLKETSAPDDHFVVDGTFTIIIGENGTVTITFEGEAVDDENFNINLTSGDGNNTIELTVTNDPIKPLPVTGGGGTGLFWLLGLLALAGAALCYYVVKQEKGRHSIKQVSKSLLVPLLLIPGAFFANSIDAQAEVDETIVTVHKRLFEEDKVMAEDKYSGAELPDNSELLRQSIPIAGVQFQVYDVTDAFKAFRQARTNLDYNEAAEAFVDTEQTSGLTPLNLSIARTDSLGETTFSLTNGRIYLLEETDAPANVYKDNGSYARNLLISLPYFDEDKEQLNHVHLYPKNEEYLRSLSFIKYGQSADGTKASVLEGAAFVLMNEAGDYWQAAGDGESAWVTSLGEATELVSDENGLVSTGDYRLPPGNYTFRETATLEGFHLTEDFMAVIPADKADAVMINGEEMGSVSIYNTEDPDIEKVVSGNRQDFAYGEPIDFTISTVVPVDISTFNYEAFTITDTADEGLVLDASSIAVQADGQTIPFTLVSSGERGFEISFDIATLTDFPGKQLLITYQMSIKEGTEPDIDLENKATFNLGHTTKEASSKVTTGGKRFVKTSVNDETNFLSGAQFVIVNGNGEYFRIVNGKAEWVAVPDTAFTSDAYKNYGLTILTSANDGSFAVKGLAYGDYSLKEVAAPDGYQLATTLMNFTVEAGTYNTGNETASAPLSIPNTPEAGTLPSTGGKLPSTGEVQSFLLIAAGLMVLFSLGLINHRRKSFGKGGTKK